MESLGQGFDAGEPPIEEIGEVDFYIEQELFDEARGKLDSLIARFPGNLDLEGRRERLEASVASTARPALLSRDEIESELLLRALHARFKIVEVPITVPFAVPGVTVWDGFKVGWYKIKTGLALRLGKA